MKHYWYYTGIKIQGLNRINTLFGTQITDEGCFDFALYHKTNGIDSSVLMVHEIDESQFEEINKMIDKYKIE